MSVLPARGFRIAFLPVFLGMVMVSSGYSQALTSIEISTRFRVQISSFNHSPESFSDVPLFSLTIDDEWFCSLMADVRRGRTSINNQIDFSWTFLPYLDGIKGNLIFQNITSDTLSIHNLVPLGESPVNLCLTGRADYNYAQRYLFRPEHDPEMILLPDSIWDIGFTAVEFNDTLKVAALARRNPDAIDNGLAQRHETILFPKGQVIYNVWITRYKDGWAEGVRKILHEAMPDALNGGVFTELFYD